MQRGLHPSMRAASAIWRWSRNTRLRIGDRRFISDARPFQAGDLVLLRNSKDRAAPPIFTKVLKPGKRIESHRGTIFHDDIIGKRVRDLVQAKTTKSSRATTEFRIHEVTLQDYCRLTKRLVTPIYAADANLIVSLLDLHPAAVEETAGGGDKLEVLEAGTGHGALTLHLSRALHAANGMARGCEADDSVDDGAISDRRAILHSIELSSKFSEHAQDVVRGFRNGLYATNVDFHVGDVSQWLTETFEKRGSKPFLSHAFLDLPSADSHLATVADALRTDGTLIIFNPSITQITSCATKVKDEGIPLDLEAVLELGVNGGSGGREWDVRFVRPRATLKAEAEAITGQPEIEDSTQSEPASESDPEHQATDDRVPGGQWSMVCRPKVGERVVGGGFLGVWKKHRDQVDTKLE